MPTSNFLSTVHRQESGNVLSVLIEIRHPSIAEPIRLCDNTEDLISNGNVYTGFPFELVLFQEDGQTPRASIRIQNVDRRIGDAVLGLTTRPTMDIAVVLSDSPDDFEFDWISTELASVDGNVIAVSGDITGIDYTSEPWPYLRATANALPGLYFQ